MGDQNNATMIRQFRTCAIWAVGSTWTVFAGNQPRKPLFGAHHYPACVKFAEQYDAKTAKEK